MARMAYYVVNEGRARYCIIDGFTGETLSGHYRRQQDAYRAVDQIMESRAAVRESAKLMDGWAL